MYLTESHIIKLGKQNYKTCDHLCFLSKNLYNSTLYYLKQEYKQGRTHSYGAVDKHFNSTNQENYRDLPAATSQQTLKKFFVNLKSYHDAIKDYNKNPSKYTGQPKFLKYKHKTAGRNIVMFPAQALGFKNGHIHFPKQTKLKPIKTNQIKESINEVRIIPRNNQYIIEVVYEVTEKELKVNNNKASIDIGVKNLMALSFSNTPNTYLYNGGKIKSVNNYFNKHISLKQAQIKKNNKLDTCKSLRSLHNKRTNVVNNLLHRYAKDLIDKLLIYDISELAIGYNKGWKQGLELGSATQAFQYIPFKRLIDIIIYKAKLQGINVIVVNESYTSKCSALDLEPICKHKSYKGSRLKRGLFESQEGYLINADINASLNIGRKVFGDEYVNIYLSNSGYGVYPVKIHLD